MFEHALDMVALQLDPPVLDRAAAAAHGFELLAHRDQSFGIQGQPPHHGHRLAATSLCFALHPHPAIAQGPRRCLRGTDTLRQRLLAVRADAAAFGGLNQIAHRVYTNLPFKG